MNRPSPVPSCQSFKLVILCICNSVTQIDEKLSKTALGGGIISEDIGEGCITKRFWQALAQCLTSPVIVAKSNI